MDVLEAWSKGSDFTFDDTRSLSTNDKIKMLCPYGGVFVKGACSNAVTKYRISIVDNAISKCSKV